MATVTINTTGAEDARIAPAYGAKLGLQRNATAAEVKAALIQSIRDTVLIYEQAQAAQAAAAAVVSVAPT
jgi:hypothetical protein